MSQYLQNTFDQSPANTLYKNGATASTPKFRRASVDLIRGLLEEGSLNYKELVSVLSSEDKDTEDFRQCMRLAVEAYLEEAKLGDLSGAELAFMSSLSRSDFVKDYPRMAKACEKANSVASPIISTELLIDAKGALDDLAIAKLKSQVRNILMRSNLVYNHQGALDAVNVALAGLPDGESAIDAVKKDLGALAKELEEGARSVLDLQAEYLPSDGLEKAERRAIRKLGMPLESSSTDFAKQLDGVYIGLKQSEVPEVLAGHADALQSSIAIINAGESEVKARSATPKRLVFNGRELPASNREGVLEGRVADLNRKLVPGLGGLDEQIVGHRLSGAQNELSKQGFISHHENSRINTAIRSMGLNYSLFEDEEVFMKAGRRAFSVHRRPPDRITTKIPHESLGNKEIITMAALNAKQAGVKPVFITPPSKNRSGPGDRERFVFEATLALLEAGYEPKDIKLNATEYPVFGAPCKDMREAAIKQFNQSRELGLGQAMKKPEEGKQKLAGPAQQAVDADAPEPPEPPAPAPSAVAGRPRAPRL